MYLALALFLATYVLLLIFGKYRAYIAAASALLFVVLGILPWAEVPAAIDWNVLLMIAGTMGTVVLFIESRMPALMADIIMEKVPNIKWAVVALSLFAGLISAFVDNVATVLMVAPVALALAKKLDISPVPVIIAIAVSSNLQGAATLVGDTTSILLGGYAGMNFLDFFVFRGRPGIFWVVQVGAVASACVLLYYFRNLRQPVESGERTQVTDTVPTLLLVSTVTLLIIVSFVPEKPAVTNGVICVLLAAVGFLRKAGQRSSVSRTARRCFCWRACSSSSRASRGRVSSTPSAACLSTSRETTCLPSIRSSYGLRCFSPHLLTTSLMWQQCCLW